jgi:hypothetical protein
MPELFAASSGGRALFLLIANGALLRVGWVGLLPYFLCHLECR